MSLFQLFRQGNAMAAIMVIVARAFVVFVCLPVHELAHGWMAYKLGDNTAKNMGRLSFNPVDHLDPLGTVMIFLFGIGYAKPVPINPNNFKNYKSGVALTALAGPLSNLIMGFIFSFISAFIMSLSNTSALSQILVLFFSYASSVNVSLAVFNLLPIPPLDGSRVLGIILPDRAYAAYYRYERTIMIVLMVLLFIGVFDTPLSYLTEFFTNVVNFIPYKIFGVS